MDTPSECLFCKIAKRVIPAQVLSESEDWIAFRDVQPQAPVHCLIVPKRHVDNLSDPRLKDPGLIGSMLLELARLAKELGVDASGYRVVTNCNRDAGQSVGHLHFHLLAGRAMHWPPG